MPTMPIEEASLLWRQAYTNYVKTIIEPGEQLPYSQHLKAIDAAINALLDAAADRIEKTPAEHPDDAAVDRFAEAMKWKMKEKRFEGYYGWDDPDQCSIERLSDLLVHHIGKGDPVDVGNFAMMIHQRGGRITPSANSAKTERRHKWASELTDQELALEMKEVAARIAKGFGEGGGSPGEWYYERFQECEAETAKRAASQQESAHG